MGEQVGPKGEWQVPACRPTKADILGSDARLRFRPFADIFDPGPQRPNTDRMPDAGQKCPMQVSSSKTRGEHGTR